MIPLLVQNKLMANWAKAESMNCNVEARVFDPASRWEWYIYAQDPENNDSLLCVERAIDINPSCLLSYEELCGLYNYNGDPMIYDHGFKPRNAAVMYKILKENH